LARWRWPCTACRGLPRISISSSHRSENIERLKTALRSVFEDPRIDDITADDLLGDYPAVQYVPPEGAFHLDLHTRLGELYDFASLESERLTFAGVSVPVVTRRMLDRMKKATVRPKDRADAAAIVEEFGPQED